MKLELVQPIKQLNKDCTRNQTDNANRLHYCERFINFIGRNIKVSLTPLSLQTKLGFISQGTIPKIHDFAHQSTLMVYMIALYMVKKLECGLELAGVALWALYSLNGQLKVIITVPTFY